MIGTRSAHPSWPAGSTRREQVRTIGEVGETIDGICYRNANLIDFDGRRYVFSHRAILTIVVVSVCNAACKFCSNEITFTPAGQFLEWDKRLARAKHFALLGGVTKVAYTGGEPTLNPARIYALMREMNPGFQRVRIHTNGFGLFREVATDRGPRALVDAMIEAGLTGVSVSVAHHDPATNREVMQLPRSWDGMSDSALAEVAARGGGSDFTPRLSCVLTAEGVTTVHDIFAYMDWGAGLGFRRFIFRTCTDIADGYKKPTAFTEYNDRNRLSIEDFARQVEDRPGVHRVFRQRKSDSKVDGYRWGDIKFEIDESSEEADPDPKIRRLNVMSNGAVHTSWIDPMSVLFEDDYDIADRAMRREFGLQER